ncbi:MAG: aromatic ring-hydroxylating oxygenase subunit alpha [Pseudomonadota bacterium]
MSRNAVQWHQKPKLPASHYVDARIYSDEALFREEQEKIFSKVWLIACHESEVPDVGDYRLYQHPAGTELIVIRGEDNKIRSFYNICSHRGAALLYDPSGNAKRITCIFHQWSYNCKGECVDITREKPAYTGRISKTDVGLREVKTEVGLGGFVWVNMDDNSVSLDEHLGGVLGPLQEALSREPLQILLYHRNIVETNYKLWHDTNSELYHDYVHYHNRITAMLQKGYWDRKIHCYPNGHCQLDSMEVRYDKYEGFGEQRKLGWPGAPDNCHIVIDLFPGITYNLRSPIFRLDTMIPLGANKVMIEYRGLGLKSDTPEISAQRVRDYNGIWGPFGRNLHEDLLATYLQGKAMHEGTDASYVLHGREEDLGPQDEQAMRHFYSEWSQRMGRLASDPYGSRDVKSAAA